MPYHTTGGHMTGCTHSEPITSYTPINQITGTHWGVWVFAFGALQVAVPPPWGDFQQHEELINGITRVAVAGVWPNGFLGRDGEPGKGFGRIYFDSRPNGATATDPNLEGNLQALVQRLVALPPDQQDPDEPQVGSPLRQLALLTYLFNHCDTGPFAPFHLLKMELPRVVDISIKRAFPPTPDPAEEYELIEVRAAGVGGFALRPYRGDDGAFLRLTNAQPQLRDDIYLGDALPLDSAAAIQWHDPELFKVAGVIQQPAARPLGEGREFDWNWLGRGGPALTGVPHA